MRILVVYVVCTTHKSDSQLPSDTPPPLPPRDDIPDPPKTPEAVPKSTEGATVTFSPSVIDNASDAKMAERKMSIASEMSTDVETVETNPTDEEKELKIQAIEPTDVKLSIPPSEEVS